jgi:isopenicillin-N epimerase
LREHFLLDPSVVFLNHGSFGACPKPVFEAYQRWQLELECQPVEFIGRRLDGLLDESRAVLAEYLNAEVDNLVYVPNATVGVNIIARSIRLQPGDEILATDHEYGACSYAWQYACEQMGSRYIQQPIPLPVTTAEAFVEQLWAGVTPNTKVIYLSHITSPTALIFPVREVCERARAAGILTMVDGAHAPGQIPLDMQAIGADFYTGNLHKWLCTPKGAAFLYARREHHDWIVPSVISWGWLPEHTFVSANQYQGTRDPAAYLAVPAAIQFQRDHDWGSVRTACHALAVETRDRLIALTELPPIAPESWFNQLFVAQLPPCDANEVKQRLYDEYRVEVPFVNWNNYQFVRVSVQGYNTRADVDTLIYGLKTILSL